MKKLYESGSLVEPHRRSFFKRGGTLANLEGGGLSCFAQGGDGFGQLWHYMPGEDGDGDELVMVFESSTDKVLESPDNICITPNGGVIFCEDDAVGGVSAPRASRSSARSTSSATASSPAPASAPTARSCSSTFRGRTWSAAA